MNIQHRRQQSSTKRKKQAKGQSQSLAKEQNDSLTNLFNLEIEEGLSKLKEKIEEQNIDNQNLMQQVKELNQQIEEQ